MIHLIKIYVVMTVIIYLLAIVVTPFDRIKQVKYIFYDLVAADLIIGLLIIVAVICWAIWKVIFC